MKAGAKPRVTETESGGEEAAPAASLAQGVSRRTTAELAWAKAAARIGGFIYIHLTMNVNNHVPETSSACYLQLVSMVTFTASYMESVWSTISSTRQSQRDIMMSLSGEGNGNLYFLVVHCLLLLLKERAHVTFKIRIKLLPLGVRPKTSACSLSFVH